MKFFLIMNPGSRAGRSSRKFKKIFALMQEHGLQYDHAITQSIDHAYQLSREVNLKGYETIVAVGGDGTINAVVNGFYDQQGRRLSKSKFAVIYTGTSPDFCKSYSIPLKPEQAIKSLARGHVKEIPIGKISLVELEPEARSSNNDILKVKFFVCCANIGLGATLARKANSGIRKLIGDSAGTFVALIATLLGFRPNDFVRVSDGESEIITKMYNCSVGLTPYIASGIKINRSDMGETGLFYCLTAKNLKLRHVVPLLRKIYSGKSFKNKEYLSITWHSKIAFSENFTNPEVEFDGDPAGFLPCTIELAEEGLEVIV